MSNLAKDLKEKLKTKVIKLVVVMLPDTSQIMTIDRKGVDMISIEVNDLKKHIEQFINEHSIVDLNFKKYYLCSNIF